MRPDGARRTIVTKMRAECYQRRMKWFVFFCCIVFIKRTDSGLISQSSIQSCDWGDSNEPTVDNGGSCKEKFVVSMTLKGGQVNDLE